MFYDQRWKHVGIRKEVLDESGHIRKGYKIVKKGEVYKRNLFTVKHKPFKQNKFVGEVMLLGRLGKNLNSQLWVAKKNFRVGGKQYCYFV